MDAVLVETYNAMLKHRPFNSAHEGYAVILEEMDELWDVVKLNPKKIFAGTAAEQKGIHRKLMRSEAIQVAAMAIRFLMDVTPDKDGRLV